MTSELDPEGVESRTLLQAADFNNARVLEIGSGDGRLAFRYANASAYVVGIEPKAKELSSALEVCPSHLRQRIGFLQAIALALPFRNGSFDIAVLAWSL